VSRCRSLFQQEALLLQTDRASRLLLRWLQFLPRDAMRGMCYGHLSVCLCLSVYVISRCSTEMAEHGITQATPHDILHEDKNLSPSPTVPVVPVPISIPPHRVGPHPCPVPTGCVSLCPHPHAVPTVLRIPTPVPVVQNFFNITCKSSASIRPIQ